MTVHGSCHCGRIRFEVEAAPEQLTDCTCSYCHRLGGLWGYYPPEQFKLTTPEADARLYQWGSRSIDHFFCDNCGCLAWRNSPVFDLATKAPKPGQRQICVNARLFEDVDIGLIPVVVIDGKNLW